MKNLNSSRKALIYMNKIISNNSNIIKPFSLVINLWNLKFRVADSFFIPNWLVVKDEKFMSELIEIDHFMIQKFWRGCNSSHCIVDIIWICDWNYISDRNLFLIHYYLQFFLIFHPCLNIKIKMILIEGKNRVEWQNFCCDLKNSFFIFN